MVELGPYPLCELCKQINGGLVAVRHRQVHLQVGDKQACVDGGLASVIATLWEVCETRSSCEDHDGRAFVVPSVETADSAERALAGLGVAVERADDGALYFRLPQRGNLPAPESADTSATPDHGDDGGFVAAIDRVTGVVAAVADRLDRNTVGIRHPRIGEARLRLDVALNRLEFAARRWRSVFRRPDNSLRVGGAVLQAGLLAGGCWTTAWAAGALTGGSPVATIVGGVLGVILIAWPTRRALTIAEDRIGQMRSARVSRGPAARLAERSAGDGGADILLPVDLRLRDVATSIDAARLEVGALAVRYLHRLGSGFRSGPALVWLHDQDAVLRGMAEADVSLRQASDAIRIWLTAPRG